MKIKNPGHEWSSVCSKRKTLWILKESIKKARSKNGTRVLEYTFRERSRRHQVNCEKQANQFRSLLLVEPSAIHLQTTEIHGGIQTRYQYILICAPFIMLGIPKLYSIMAIFYILRDHKAQAIFCVSLYTIQFINLFYQAESSFASEKLLFMRVIIMNLFIENFVARIISHWHRNPRLLIKG